MYGLADSRLAGSELGEVIELFVRRERALADVLADEPTWRGQLSVVTIELVEGSGRTTSEPL
jgi:hypothetical protein